MKSKTKYAKKCIIVITVLVSVVCVSYLQAIFMVPETIMLLEGKEYTYNFNTPFFVNIKADKMDVIKLNNSQVSDYGQYCKLYTPVQFKTQREGRVNLKMKIFGLIPFKTMKVDVVSNRKIAACGNTIGVKMNIDGVLVIGLSDVENGDGSPEFPAKESGIRVGDIIFEGNNKKLHDIDDLISVIDSSKGNKLLLKYRRGTEIHTAYVTPIKSIDDKKYHLGLWVRDSTAGIGTLTFFDPETNKFGALGHGITDIDTGTLMPVSDGEILEARILAVKKGRAGAPGELKGVFVEDGVEFGSIVSNNESGIFGNLTDKGRKLAYTMYDIGLRSQVKEGEASILVNIDGSNVKEYSIEIQKVSRQNVTNTKSMIIKITDKRLLEATGGIVQGMSGSPIIQDNRIIGAVTHVLVNDPTRGYGIFIESMLKNMESGDQKDLQEAS